MNKTLLQKIQFDKKLSIRKVMAYFNETAVDTLGSGFGIVVDEGSCIGVITDGDIRRELVNGLDIDTPVEVAMNRKFISATKQETPHQILRLFDSHIQHIPILDAQKKVIDLFFFQDFKASGSIEEKVIRVRTPLRISFAGGGTDMTYYFQNHPGFVLSSTINKYCYVSIFVRADKKITICSNDYHETIEAVDLQHLKYGGSLDLIKASIKLMEPDFGFDLKTYSEIEPGTGLGGSSAISASIIGALNHFRNENHLNKYHLADLSYQAERVELGISGGWQDQYATIFGGLNFIEFRHDEIMVFPIRVPEDLMLELHFNLMLFRFGQPRDSSSIINDQQKQFLSSKQMLEKQYSELAKLTLQMKDTLLKGSLKQFGSFLHTGWEIKKRFSSKISSTYIDNLYQTARKAGALGGKVLGAGAGGYLLLYCDPQYHSIVTEALEEKGAKHDPFDFVENGLQVWSTTA